MEHFKTKAKASDENHITFVFTSENARPTPHSNKPLDKSETSDIDFATASLSFDINKNEKTTVTSIENIVSSTPNPIRNFPITKSIPEILPLIWKAVTLKEINQYTQNQLIFFLSFLVRVNLSNSMTFY